MPYKDMEKRRACNRRWEAKNRPKRSKVNRVQLLKRHGLTEADYARMVAERDGCCDICKKAVEKLFIDHDHTTLKIRGLLCNPCNLVLGHAKDSADVLRAAISYLS